MIDYKKKTKEGTRATIGNTPYKGQKAEDFREAWEGAKGRFKILSISNIRSRKNGKGEVCDITCIYTYK